MALKRHSIRAELEKDGSNFQNPTVGNYFDKPHIIYEIFYYIGGRIPAFQFTANNFIAGDISCD